MFVFFFYFPLFGEELLLVVERERGRLTLLSPRKGRLAQFESLGKLHHGVVKFHKGSAYVLSRDGWLSQVSLSQFKVLRKAKVGKSSIGLTFSSSFLVVANYEPGSVVILDQQLKRVHHISTQSRVVGIKEYKGKILFTLMDRREIWQIQSTPPFPLLSRHPLPENLPFDALLVQDWYIVAFFQHPSLCLFHIPSGKIHFLPLLAQGRPLFKIPHLGAWGVSNNRVYIPATGEKKIYIWNTQKRKLEGFLPLRGFPIFAKVSPCGRFLVVNYSGREENWLSCIDLLKKTRQDWLVGRRILHFSFLSKDTLCLSSYFEHKVKAYKIPSFELLWQYPVATPSGVFVVPQKGEENG